MKDLLYIIWAILGILVIYNLIIVILIKHSIKKIKKKDWEIIELFMSKINKIPALVEIMKKYTNHPDIFEDTIYIHKQWIIRNIRSVEDLRELNFRLHREFQFLMNLSAKIRELHRDGNFLYIRNYVIFYENNINKLLKEANIHLDKYNQLVRYKNISILWLIIPYREKIVF